MKAGWTTDRTEFMAKLREFQSAVLALANEMFETDKNGELPIYVRIVDRAAFKEDNEDPPFDVGLQFDQQTVLACVSADHEPETDEKPYQGVGEEDDDPDRYE
jgi:hypothetical protein